VRPWLFLLVLGCGGATPPQDPAPATIAPDPTADAAALARAEAAARDLGKTLKTRAAAAMGAGGPTEAAEVCGTEAKTLTAEVAKRDGVAVGRSSRRLRNPTNAGAARVSGWLESEGERAAEGVEPYREAVQTPKGRSARVILPITVEAPCLVCHGPADPISADVRGLLAERYPRDRATGYATGYATGDLRGALWAEAASC